MRVLLLLVLVVPLVVPAEPAPRPSADTVLATLAVKGRAPKTGYSREQFGPAWADVDRNGCDTRDDVLNRDLDDKQWRPGTHGCVVVAGRLVDPYTGRLIVFAKADAEAVQIDHVVSLSDAWQKGAAGWSSSRRRAFANDRLNLLAVDGPTNAQKSDGDTATWLPPRKSYRCRFVARQVAVKARWRLWITQAEHDAMARVLSRCPGPGGSRCPRERTHPIGMRQERSRACHDPRRATSPSRPAREGPPWQSLRAHPRADLACR